VRNASLWRALFGVEKAVVESVEFDEDEQLVVACVRRRGSAVRTLPEAVPVV
jgi:transposase